MGLGGGLQLGPVGFGAGGGLTPTGIKFGAGGGLGSYGNYDNYYQPSTYAKYATIFFKNIYLIYTIKIF